jgi:hypothetical protein
MCVEEEGGGRESGQERVEKGGRRIEVYRA